MHKNYGQICNFISYHVIYVGHSFFKTIVSLQICPNWVDCKYVAQGSSLCPSVILHANQMEEKTLFPIISLFLSLPAFPNTLLGN